MNQWQAWNDKFIALTQREKVIVALAVIFLVTYGLFFIAVKPALDSQNALYKSKQQISKQVDAISTQITNIKQALTQDPNAELKQQIKQLNAEIAKVESALSHVMDDYVAPEKMVKELTRLLETERQIRVTGLSAMSPELIKADFVEGEDTIELPVLYSHKFELIVEGEYFPLMNFVKTVVARNKQFAVDDLRYEVDEHPKAQLTLTLVTISDSKNVIRL